MKLDFLLVAENAFVDQSEKLSIIQTIDVISSDSFPIVYPKVCAVARWIPGKGESISGKFIHRLEILGPGKEVVATNESTNILPANNTLTSLQYIVNVVAVRFETPGKYTFRLYLNGKLNKKETVVRLEKNT